MPTDVLQSIDAAVEFLGSGGDVTLSTASLAAGAGRASAEYDHGGGATTSRPIRFTLEAGFKFNAAPAVGDGVEVHVFGYNVNTERPAGLSGSDAALGGTNDERLRNSLFSMTVEAWSTSTSDLFRNSREFESACRYFIVVVYNRTGNSALSATEADCWVKLTPTNPEAQ